MSLSSENINHEEIMKLLEVQRKFINTEGMDRGSRNLFYDVIEYFDIDRIYMGMKQNIKKDCVPIVEYVKGKEPKFLGDVLDFRSYAKFTDVEINEQDQEFMDLIDENNYFLGSEFDKISHLLNHLGYVPSGNGNPKECMVFYIKTDETFGFLFMERYGDRKKTLSKLERVAIENVYSINRMKTKKEYLKERIYNETNMKDAILENENMPMCMVNKNDKTVIYFNEDYKKIVQDVAIGDNYDKLFDENMYFGKNYNTRLVPNTETLVHYKKDNNVLYFIKKVIPLTLIDGTEALMVYVKYTDDYIRQLEGVDLLTSAYSSKGFSSYFKNNVENYTKNDYILCSFDVAKFKYINDTKGFKTGNKLLKEIATVLTAFIRNQEIFCRVNEDKFAILLQAETNEEVEARIKNLYKKLELMREKTFEDIEITYVCGVAKVEPNIEINILLDKANITRKNAKGSHKNVIAFFDEEMERKLANEVNIESRVSKAVEEGEFKAYLQPKFNLKTNKICGAEALVRWITPTGMIFPDSFIPLFEKNGFITTLDFIVYKRVMKYIRSCLDRNLPVYPISLNVSRNHIRNKNFTKQIMDLAEEYDIPIELLELEITESVFVEDKEVLKFFVDNIKHIKIKVSIDDFGSAYSSLQTLTDIDMDILKIDKGFLDNIRTDGEYNKDELVLKNIINLAKDLKCKVICEGVETEEQIKFLQDIGCEYGQGYVFAKPMPIEEYEERFLINSDNLDN